MGFYDPYSWQFVLQDETLMSSAVTMRLSGFLRGKRFGLSGLWKIATIRLIEGRDDCIKIIDGRLCSVPGVPLRHNLPFHIEPCYVLLHIILLYNEVQLQTTTARYFTSDVPLVSARWQFLEVSDPLKICIVGIYIELLPFNKQNRKKIIGTYCRGIPENALR